MNHDTRFDAMDPRRMVSRWVITGQLVTQTATHFGGESDMALDMPILRCRRTDRPLLPGSTLAGALRAHLQDRLCGYAEGATEHETAASEDHTPSAHGRMKDREHPQVSVLFGSARGDDGGGQSPLIVFDALGKLPQNAKRTEIRDGVQIQMATGTAAAHKKFDFEVLPPASGFDIRFDVIVPTQDDEAELLSLLVAAIEGLDNGDIQIGLRRSRGLGQVSTRNWTATRFDLSSADGWLEWILSDHVAQPASASTCTITEAIHQELPNSVIVERMKDNRNRIVIEAEAAVDGELLIRSSNDRAPGPDVMHLMSGGKPVISGTTLAGSLRAQALKIAQLVHRIDRDRAETMFIAPLFGPREEGTQNPDFKPRASRLRICECFVDGGNDPEVTRVAIDRFTQGTIATALFEEQPHAGGNVKLRFEIRNPEPHEVGLLLLALRDLLTGRLAVGGTGAIGRGVLRGISINGHNFSADKPPDDPWFQQQVQAFVDAAASTPTNQGASA